MKLIKLLTFSILTSTLLFACGSKEEKKEDNKESEENNTIKTEEENSGIKTPLEGTWEIKRTKDFLTPFLDVGSLFEFKGSNLTIKSLGSKSPGTTVVTNAYFSFQANGDDLKFMYKYKLEGDTLIVSMNNNVATFYMVKQ